MADTQRSDGARRPRCVEVEVVPTAFLGGYSRRGWRWSPAQVLNRERRQPPALVQQQSESRRPPSIICVYEGLRPRPPGLDARSGGGGHRSWCGGAGVAAAAALGGCAG